MSGPQSASEWAAFFSERRDKALARAAAERARAPKPKPGANDMHPLLRPPSFSAATPIDVQEHFINSFLAHRDHAHAEVRRHQEARAAEHHRRNAPHPLAHGPLAQIPVPQPRRAR